MMPDYRFALAEFEADKPIMTKHNNIRCLITICDSTDLGETLALLPTVPLSQTKWLQLNSDNEVIGSPIFKTLVMPAGYEMKTHMRYENRKDDTLTKDEHDKSADFIGIPESLMFTETQKEHIARHILESSVENEILLKHIPDTTGSSEDCPWCRCKRNETGENAGFTPEMQHHLAIHILQEDPSFDEVTKLLMDRTYDDCPMCEYWRP